MPLQSGTLANRPVSGTYVGDPYCAIDTGETYSWDGTQWVKVGMLSAAHGHPQSDITNLVTDLSGKTTLTAVKADTDVADSLTKKHANTLDHSNSLDHNGGTQDTAIAGKEPANANIQVHVTSAHAPSNAQANADITKAEIEAKLTEVISSHSHAGGGGMTLLKKTADQV